MPPPPKEKQRPNDEPDKPVPGSSWESDQRDRGYYYDDAYGYELYKENENEEGPKPLEIWTIGHSTRSLAEFLGLLTDNHIEGVADVRSFPGSRKFPHFNAEALGPALAEAGISYQQIKTLGGRRKANKNSMNTVWRHEAFRAYADHMETPEFVEGIRSLLDLAATRRTAIMCAEAVWWRCHRSMIADYLRSVGVEVEHIVEGGKLQVHPYTSAAKIVGGKLVYGPSDSSGGTLDVDLDRTPPLLLEPEEAEKEP